MKFRKKPVEVEAFRWTADATQEMDPIWIREAIEAGRIHFLRSGTPEVRMVVQTLEGRMEAQPGDWIVRGVKGEIYPVKPEIFEMTYDAIDE